MAAPSAVGDFQVTTFWDSKGRFAGNRIDRADPIIRISCELVTWMRLQPDHGWFEFDGDIIRLHGVNRTVVYRLGPPRPDGYQLAEWPD